jgi:hypothetical protein
MADAHLLRSTLDTVDDFVERLRRGAARAGHVLVTPDGEPTLVIDEGRASAEWSISIEIGGDVERLGLLVTCDVAGSRLTDARLYVALPRRMADEIRPAPS